MRRRVVISLVALVLWGLGALATPAGAAPPGADAAAPADYRSKHVLLHTDMPSDEARELLNRLETVLGLISKYWGQPVQGEIECYVVRDLSVWPADALSEIGRAKIRQRSGITTTQTLNRGKQFIAGKSIVWAIDDGGTPQHEIVHAYCGQTFGGTGPLWYSEGMAELGQYWQEGNKGVACRPVVIDYLNNQATKSVAQIVGDSAGDGDRTGAARTGDSWQSYASRWALCHLLVNNANYSGRFRNLGLSYLRGATTRFEDVFGALADELQFEYDFFTRHVGQGYRADLCAWDWHHKFREPSSSAISSRVMANRGWQPSGAVIARGQAYEITASGNWKLDSDGNTTTADGLPSGNGRLEGVVFRDFKLGTPFPLSASGTFVAPDDGKLFLRCRENWCDLADNSGQVTVKIMKTASSPDLPRPSDAVSAGR